MPHDRLARYLCNKILSRPSDSTVFFFFFLSFPPLSVRGARISDRVHSKAARYRAAINCHIVLLSVSLSFEREHVPPMFPMRSVNRGISPAIRERAIPRGFQRSNGVNASLEAADAARPRRSPGTV